MPPAQSLLRALCGAASCAEAQLCALTLARQTARRKHQSRAARRA